VWHPISHIELDGCECAYVFSIVDKRLWIASTLKTDKLYYIGLPAGYGDVAADSNCLFESDGYFETPWLYGNFKGDSKAFVKFTLTMEDTTTGNYFRAYYKKLGDDDWREINPTTYFKTSPVTSAYIPVDASGNKPTSTMIKFLIMAVTGANTDTPILKSYDCRAILYPTRRNIIRAVVRCADDMKDKQGGDLGNDAEAIRETLIEARDATWPVTLYDPWGNTKYVRLLSTEPFSRIIKQEKGLEPEEHYYLEMLEVTLS